MTKEELFRKIRTWEIVNGESFNDYFCHDNITNRSWAFWLLGKGFIEHANRIIDEILKGETCLNQELLYDVYNVDEQINEYTHWNESNYNLNVMLLAEFLLATPYYTQKVEKFFKENEEEND